MSANAHEGRAEGHPSHSLLGAPLPRDHTCPASCLHLRLRSQPAPFVLPVPDTPRDSSKPSAEGILEVHKL